MQNDQFIIDLLLNQWETKVNHLTGIFNYLGEKSANKEMVPGKNSVSYLLGHLTVASDRMFEALDLGKRRVEEYDHFFFEPHNSATEYPLYLELLANWVIVNDILLAKMKALTAEDWLKRHTYVSAADFANEPHRNKVNLLISRTAHLSNHYGQLLLAK